MATVKHSSSNSKNFETARAVQIEWANLKQGDDGSSFSGVDLPDKTIQVKGTFGGTTVTLEDDDDNTLDDHLGNALSFTSKGCKLVAQNPGDINPKLTGGDGTTDITVTIYATGGR